MDLNEVNRLNGNEHCCCEEDEEDLFRNDSPEALDYFDLIVGQLEDILIDQHFQKLQRDFLDKYCSEFDDTEENKLSYMEIFEDYVSTIEKNIEDRLKLEIPDFSMERFQNELEENKGSLDGEVFEMLYTLSDFMAFKSLMLDFKARARPSVAADPSSVMGTQSVDEISTRVRPPVAADPSLVMRTLPLAEISARARTSVAAEPALVMGTQPLDEISAEKEGKNEDFASTLTVTPLNI